MGLEFLIVQETNRSYGAGVGSFIGYLLSESQPDFGDALSRIEITLLFNGRVNADREDMPGTYLRGLPAALFSPSAAFPPLERSPGLRFERKRRILKIEWVSSRVTPDEAFGTYFPTMTRDLFERLFAEVFDALKWGLSARIQPSDGFDVAGCLAHVQELRGLQFASDDDLRERLGRASDTMKERYKAMDPWDRLDIDWSKYAQDARALLDDPDDWSEGHDFAPHGNDTGADIWTEWETFRHLSPEAATEFVGMVFPHGPEDEIAWRHWVQVHLALAFGHIKMSGTCPQPLRTNALNVLKTERTTAETRTDWPYLTDWLARLDRYIRILEDLPD